MVQATKTHSVNQDLGDGWRFVSFLEPEKTSRLVLTTLSKSGKTYLTRFDVDKGILIDEPRSLTTTQLHIIKTVLTQFMNK